MKHHRAKLDARQVREIRKRAGAGESQAALAHAFKVSKPCISQIIHRDTWKDVDDNSDHLPTIQDLREWAQSIGATDTEDVEASLFVLALLYRDTNPDQAAAETGIPLARCELYAQRLRENGILVDGKWYADPGFGEDPKVTEMEIVLWGLVANGTVECVSGKERVAREAKEKEMKRG